MRKTVFFTVLSLAAFSVAAQQQPPQQGNQGKPPGNQGKPATSAERHMNGKQESAYEWRIRADGSAGGTMPPPPEEREGVGAGAKEHMHFDPIDRGLYRRSHSEVIAPAK